MIFRALQARRLRSDPFHYPESTFSEIVSAVAKMNFVIAEMNFVIAETILATAEMNFVMQK